MLSTLTNGLCPVTIIRTWSATNSCDTSFATCSQTVTVMDVSPPIMSCAKSRIAPCGAAWDFEEVRDHYLAQLFDIDPVALRERDGHRYLALGRLATAEAMRRTIAEWRRPGSSCRGALIWLARDVGPGAGWGLVDSTGRPKAAYWYVRRVCAPIALLGIDEGLNGLWLHAINDTPRAVDADPDRDTVQADR